MKEILFNKDIDAMQPSASIVFSEKAKRLAAEGKEVLSLTIGEPNFDTPKAVVEKAVEQMRAGNTHYCAGRGLPVLRKRIAKKLREENGIQVTEDEILVTPGAKFAIYVVVRTLLNQGDEAIVLDPCWVSYSAIITAAGGKAVSVELPFETKHEITMELLESGVSEKTRLLILNTPNNPTGRMLNEKEAAIVAEFAKKHDIFVISDEIYEKIVFDGNKHISLAANPEIADRVITINGLSKCAAMTGWRVGYLAGPKAIVDKINMLYQHAMTCIAGFAQEAAAVALDCTEEVEMQRSAFENRRDAFIKILSQSPAIQVHVPEGAFYAWVKFDYKGMSGAEICDYLLDTTGVLGVPGFAYGKGGDDCIRFSLATDDKTLLEAARRIVKAVEQ